jgi:hypothetical protein
MAGEYWHSKKEYSRYQELLLLQKAGEIRELKRQVRFTFTVNNVKICTYVSDFTYIENSKYIVEDVKSSITRKLPTYRIKKKLLLALNKINIKEV